MTPQRGYWVLAVIIFLGFVANGATSPFFALYATSLGASLGQIAFVVGVQSAVAVIAGLVIGRVTDRIGRRPLTVSLAMASLALLNLAITRVPSWGWLVPLHALLGLASGAYQVVSLALMGDLLAGHPQRGRFISGYRMSGSLAFSIAIVASGQIAQAIGLRGSFQLAAGVYLLAFLVSLLIGEPVRVQARAAPVGFLLLLRGPLRPLLLLALAFGVPFAAVFSVWPIWVADTLGLGRATFAWLWGIAAFIEVPSMVAAGVIVDRLGHRPTFIVGLAGFALVYALYALAPTIPGLVAAQALRGIAFAAFTATALTMAIDLAPPEARGRASGLFTSAQGIAQITGNWVGAPLAAALGFPSLFALAAASVLGGAVYSFFVRGRVVSPPAEVVRPGTEP
ncbi:MAG TPA: MFS transporter [Isosphaeraceae bacterium]|nr:MFS transporter [Isosphaeraceae bacterium]